MPGEVGEAQGGIPQPVEDPQGAPASLDGLGVAGHQLHQRSQVPGLQQAHVPLGFRV